MLKLFWQEWIGSLLQADITIYNIGNQKSLIEEKLLWEIFDSRSAVSRYNETGKNFAFFYFGV